MLSQDQLQEDFELHGLSKYHLQISIHPMVMAKIGMTGRLSLRNQIDSI